MKHEMEFLEVGEVDVLIEEGFAYCYRNAGVCYGGIKCTIVDLWGKTDIDDITQHIGEYAGAIFAQFIRYQSGS